MKYKIVLQKEDFEALVKAQEEAQKTALTVSKKTTDKKEPEKKK